MKYVVLTPDLRSYLVDDPGDLQVICTLTERRAVEDDWMDDPLVLAA